jgi:hypothetical protein
LQNCKVLVSNGHNWRMYEFDLDYESRATHIYRPRSASEVFAQTGDKPLFKIAGDPRQKKIWNDFRHIEICLGLIKFAMNVPTEQEEALQKTYSFLKEVEGTEFMTQEEQDIVTNRARRSRFLPKFMRRLYVGSSFYLEEVEKEEKQKKQYLEERSKNKQIEEENSNK